MLSETPGRPGRSAQMPRTIRSIFTPAREAAYSASITCGSVSAFMRAMMRPSPPLAARTASPRISSSSRWCRVNGDCSSTPQLRRARQAGQVQEDLVHVQADGRIAGQQSVVGVGARRLLVVVARAQVAVAAHAIGLAAHHQDHLRVRLVADHAVHHVHAGFLQAVGQADVGFLVEARAQLDDGGDVLAVVRGRHQRIDDGRVGAGAVQRLLDGQHLRIGGRQAQEIQHRRETLEGMVQQHIAFAQLLEQVVAPCEGLAGSAGAKGAYFRSGRGASS